MSRRERAAAAAETVDPAPVGDHVHVGDSALHAPSDFSLCRRGSGLGFAGTIVGRTHVQRGGPREDAFHLAYGDDDSTLVGAVADGVGSTDGASLASHAAVRAVGRALSGLDLATVLRSAGDDLRRQEEVWAVLAHLTVTSAIAAVERSATTDPGQGLLGAGSTTLSFAAAVLTAQGVTVAWAAVGDSPMFAVVEPDRFGWVWQPPERPSTDALPRPREEIALGIERLPAGSTFLLATDGMAEVLAQHLELAPQMAHLLKGAVPGRTQQALADLMQTPASGAHDDRTLVMLTTATDVKDTAPPPPPPNVEQADGLPPDRRTWGAAEPVAEWVFRARRGWSR